MINKNRRPRQKASQQASAEEKVRVKKKIALIVVISLLWLFFAPGLGIVSYMNKKAELQRVENEAIDLKKANVKLQEEIDKLLTDPVYLEKIAREKYNLLKPNEKVYDFSKKSKKSKK
jgi:cell division protein FtsB